MLDVGDHDVQQVGARAGQRFTDRRPQLLRLDDPLGGDAKRGGHHHKVRVDVAQVARDVVLALPQAQVGVCAVGLHSQKAKVQNIEPWKSCSTAAMTSSRKPN